MLPCVIDQDFLITLAESVQEALVEELGLGTQEATQRAAEFLAEEPEVLAEREQLAARMARLDDILEKLARFKA